MIQPLFPCTIGKQSRSAKFLTIKTVKGGTIKHVFWPYPCLMGAHFLEANVVARFLCFPSRWQRQIWSSLALPLVHRPGILDFR